MPFSGFLIRRSRVRVTPGAPISRVNVIYMMMSRPFPSRALRRIATVGFAAAVLFTGSLGGTTPGHDNLKIGPAPALLGPSAARIVSLNSEHKFVVIDFASRVDRKSV